MDRRFLRSREFLVAAALAAVVLVAGALAATMGLMDVGDRSDGCTVDDPAGDPLQPDVREEGPTRSGDTVERTVTYTLDPETRDGGTFAACADTGHVTVEPADGEQVQVEVHLSNTGDGATEAVRQASVPVAFADEGGELDLAADHPEPTHVEEAGHRRSTSLALTVRVPSGLVPDLDASVDEGELDVADVGLGAVSAASDEGDTTLDGVSAADLSLASDEGEIRASGLEAGGDADLASDEGSIDVAVSSVSAGSWSVASDEGDSTLTFPRNDRTGYDVVAESEDGDVQVDIGPTEHRSSQDEDGERVEARTDGYSDRAVQVSVDAVADEGDVEVHAR